MEQPNQGTSINFDANALYLEEDGEDDEELDECRFWDELSCLGRCMTAWATVARDSEAPSARRPIDGPWEPDELVCSSTSAEWVDSVSERRKSSECVYMSN